MAHLRRKLPEYRRYGRRYARTHINGRDIHLGVFDSQESREKYEQLIDQWLKNEMESQPTEKDDPTVLAIIGLYFSHGQADLEIARHRPRADGSRSHLQLAMQILSDSHGKSPARDFDAAKLRLVQLALAKQGLRRREINDAIGFVKQVFVYAIRQALLEGSVSGRLAQVNDLKRGELGAPE